MTICSTVYQQLMSIPASPEERGGILFGKDGHITRTCLDQKHGSIGSYAPCNEFLFECLANNDNSRFPLVGIFHTHNTTAQANLSMGDRLYIETFMDLNQEVNEFYFPVVIPGELMTIFKAIRDKNGIEIVKEPFEVIK